MNLEDALDGALEGTRRALTITEIIEDFPSLAELAEFFTRGAPKGSKEYLAARRRFERYRQGTRRPSPEFLRRFRRRLRRRTRQLRSKGAAVQIEGILRVSNDARRRSVGVKFDGAVVDRLLQLRRDGELEEAADVFNRAFAAVYVAGTWDDVDELTMEELRA